MFHLSPFSSREKCDFKLESSTNWTPKICLVTHKSRISQILCVNQTMIRGNFVANCRTFTKIGTNVYGKKANKKVYLTPTIQSKKKFFWRNKMWQWMYVQRKQKLTERNEKFMLTFLWFESVDFCLFRLRISFSLVLLWWH